MPLRTFTDTSYAASASGTSWTSLANAAGAPDSNSANFAGTGSPTAPTVTCDFADLALPSWPAAMLDESNTSITITVRCAIQHSAGPGTFTDGKVTATVKLRGGTVTASGFATIPLGAGLTANDIGVALNEFVGGSNITPAELEAMEIDLVFEIVDLADDFEPTDEITADLDSVEATVTMTGEAITYLPDPPPGTKRIIPFCPMNTGTEPGGMGAAFVADPIGWLTTRFADPTAAGFLVRCYFWCSGSTTAVRGAHVGCGPVDYPGEPPCPTLETEPIDMATSLEIAGVFDPSDLPVLLVAHNSYYAFEAALSGTSYRPHFYSAPPPARTVISDISVATIASYRPILDCDGELLLDILSKVDYTNPMACPFIFDPVNQEASVLLGWWASNQLIYSDAGVTAITADGTALQQWNSLSGSSNWIQTTAGDKPSYQTNELNGLPAIRFDGAADNMDLAAVISLTRNFNIWLICKPAASDQIALSYTGFNRQLRFNEGGAGVLSGFNGTENVRSNGAQFTASAWSAFRFHGDNDLSILVNGTAVSGYSTAQTFSSDGIDFDNLGSFSGSSNFFSGDIANLFVINEPSPDQNYLDLIAGYIEQLTGIAQAGSGDGTLPARAVWEHMATNYPQCKLWTESWETLPELFGDPTSRSGWMDYAAAADAAGGIVASTNRHRDTFNAGTPATYGRADLAVLGAPGYDTPTTIKALLNSNGTPLRAGVIIDQGTNDYDLALDAIRWWFDNGADIIYVQVDALDATAWVDAFEIEVEVNGHSALHTLFGS